MVTSTTTASPTQTAPATPVSPTDIEVAGQHFELHGLSVADGERLYRALPSDYQKLAEQYGAIARNFERIASVQLPKGMTLKQALENYKNALMAGAGKLSGTPEPYLQQLDATCRSIPGYAGMVDGLTGAKNAADLAGTAIGAASDTVSAPLRFFSFLGTVVTEGTGALTPRISDAQARAFGAAYAAALYHEGAVRQTMTTGQMIWNHPVEASLAGLDNLVLNVPLLKDAWPYIYAAWKWVSGAVAHFGDTTTKAPTFSEALAEAKSEIEASRGRHPDWRSNVEARLRAGDLDAASATMAKAEKVADIATQPIAEAVKDDKTIVTRDGNLATIRTQDGSASIETDTTSASRDQTRGDRIGNAARQILGQTGNDLVNGRLTAGGVLATAAGSGSALWVANKLTPGGLTNIPTLAGHGAVSGIKSVARASIAGTSGLLAGMVEGTAELIPFGGARAARKAGDAVTRLEAQVERHAARADALKDAIDTLKASGPASAEGLRGKLSGAAHDLKIRNEEARLASAEKAHLKTTSKLPAAEARLTETLEHSAARVEAGGIRGWLTSTASWLSGKATQIEHLGDSGIHGVVNLSERLVENGAAEKLAIRATRIGGVALRFGRAIPLVGFVLTTGTMLLSSSAHAAEWNAKTGGDGKSRNLTDQLEYDHNRGAIGDKEYAALKAAQVAYAASGLGGIVTAGVAEGVQNVVEKLGRDRVQLYLPPSIVASVGEVTGAVDGKAHFTQAELNAAMAGVKAQAHKAARPMVASSVTVGAAIKAPSDDNISIAGFKIPTLGLNHLFG